jgi:hypothetical protein
MTPWYPERDQIELLTVYDARLVPGCHVVHPESPHGYNEGIVGGSEGGLARAAATAAAEDLHETHRVATVGGAYESDGGQALVENGPLVRPL